MADFLDRLDALANAATYAKMDVALPPEMAHALTHALRAAKTYRNDPYAGSAAELDAALADLEKLK